MSKVFEALSKSKGAIAELALDVVGVGSRRDASPDGDKSAGPAGSNNVHDQPPTEVPRPVPFTGEATGAESASSTMGPPAESAQESTRNVRTDEEASDQVLQDTAGLVGESWTPAPALVDEADWPSTVFVSPESEVPPSNGGPSVLSFAEDFDHTGDELEAQDGRDEATRSLAVRLEAGKPLLPFDHKGSAVASEQYRLIRTRLLHQAGRPRLLLLSSAQASDGKSITSINIAGALALNDETQVLLVDTDLRRSSLAAMLGVPNTPGVMDVLTGACSMEQAVVRLEPFSNLYFLPAGQDTGNPTELLSSQRWHALCQEVRSQVTYAIFDGPPVDVVADYRLLEKTADGVLLVVRTDHTKRSALSSAIEAVNGDKLVGVVVNGYRDSFLSKKRTDYRYYGYSSKERNNVSQS